MDFVNVIVVLAILIYSCILHEMMHAWAADRLGDPTGRLLGRITLNPLPHIDPINTILMPILLWVMSNGKFCLGGAKPVPINPMNFRRPGQGMMLSALAGPLTNVALALAGAGVLVLLARWMPEWLVQEEQPTWNFLILYQIVMINVMLAIFNMIPIPPLDGSRVLRYFLPHHLQKVMDQMERFGLVLVLVFVFAGGTRVLWPLIDLIKRGLFYAMGSRGF